MTRSAALSLATASLPILLRLEPERAHRLALRGLKALRPFWPTLEVPPNVAVDCAGLRFEHPVGIAAGFDKDGDYLDALDAVGFSHVEIGTVTPRPQPGNPPPRIHRIPAATAVVNRMGFNSKGIAHVVQQLQRSTFRGIRGVSIGKNADTPIENAAVDYLACLRAAYSLADFFAINVSSPNTSDLRRLQGELWLLEGDPVEAVRHLHASLAVTHDLRDMLALIETLIVLAAARRAAQEPARVARLLGTLSRLVRETGIRHGARHRSRRDALEQQLRASLPPDHFGAAWA